MRVVVSERSCARARRALSLVLDREAAAADVQALALHLGVCGGCRRYAAEVSAFTRDLRSAAIGRSHLHITDQKEGMS